MSVVFVSGPSKPTQGQVEDTTGSKITKHGGSSDQRRLDCGREDYLSDVSIVLPVHNAERWLDQCLESVLDQDFQGSMQLSVFNDASKDDSMNIIENWQTKLVKKGIHVIIGGHESACPKGVGFAKNQAIAQSFGRFLCFLDADDVMMPQRVRVQYDAALALPQCVIGCQVKREPEGSTERYTRWINSLTQEQLLTQVVVPGQIIGDIYVEGLEALDHLSTIDAVWGKESTLLCRKELQMLVYTEDRHKMLE